MLNLRIDISGYLSQNFSLDWFQIEGPKRNLDQDGHHQANDPTIRFPHYF